MDLFSFPKTRKKKEGSGIYFNDWNSHPAEWIEYGNYCKQDCVAEQEVARREVLLGAFPLSERERNIWIFDQKVNDRGIPVDVKFVRNMYELGSRSKKEAVDKQNELTGLENANSPIQMLAWAKTQGYKPGTLNKTTVEAQLKYHRDTLTPLAIEVLEARKAASSTTYKKLATVLRQVSPDSRLRNALVYMGSARCGRWSSAAVQIHNLSRSGIVGGYNFEDEEIMNEARDMVYNMDYEGIQEKYGSVLLVVKNLIRTVFSL
jgi:DNA polymerase